MKLREACHYVLRHYALYNDGYKNNYIDSFMNFMKRAKLTHDAPFISHAEFIDCLKRTLADNNLSYEDTLNCLRYKVRRNKERIEAEKRASQPIYAPPAPDPKPRPTPSRNPEVEDKQSPAPSMRRRR